jgi:hypothetical protein
MRTRAIPYRASSGKRAALQASKTASAVLGSAVVESVIRVFLCGESGRARAKVGEQHPRGDLEWALCAALAGASAASRQTADKSLHDGAAVAMLLRLRPE